MGGLVVVWENYAAPKNGDNITYLNLFAFRFFYGFYHGKSLRNHPFGRIFWGTFFLSSLAIPRELPISGKKKLFFVNPWSSQHLIIMGYWCSSIFSYTLHETKQLAREKWCEICFQRSFGLVLEIITSLSTHCDQVFWPETRLWFHTILCSPLELGKWSKTDFYFSNRLKPPGRKYLPSSSQWPFWGVLVSFLGVKWPPCGWSKGHLEEAGWCSKYRTQGITFLTIQIK